MGYIRTAHERSTTKPPPRLFYVLIALQARWGAHQHDRRATLSEFPTIGRSLTMGETLKTAWLLNSYSRDLTFGIASSSVSMPMDKLY